MPYVLLLHTRSKKLTSAPKTLQLSENKCWLSKQSSAVGFINVLPWEKAVPEALPGRHGL